MNKMESEAGTRGSSNTHEDDENVEQAAAVLGDLLSALAVGVRSVSSLPTTQDDMEYAMSFPEYAQQLMETQGELAQLLKEMVGSSDNDDVQLMELCADACDAWTEQAEAYLTNTSHETLVKKVQHVASKSRQQASTKFSLLMGGLVDMPKPQITFGIAVDNSRDGLFVPSVHPDKPFSKVPLDLTPRNGRPMDTKYGLSPAQYFKQSASKVGPNKHVPHPYRTELEQLQYQEWMTTVPKKSKPPSPIVVTPEDALQGIWIDTEEQLQKLSKKLETVDKIAIDLEAHSYRTFAGMLCLMQITIHEKGDAVATTIKRDYLVDTLKLWNHMNSAFASALANPAIVKVFHGADSDIQWLQRDFGLYVVNLFDTGQAARCLKLPKFGFASILQKYVGIETDKSLQMSDWRQRPLPPKMRKYAVLDTHYLLDIYEHLKWDLEHHSSPQVSISKVLEASNLVALIRYEKDLFDSDGYKSMIRSSHAKSKRNKKADLTPSSQDVLKALWNWRDLTARSEDESLQAVCGNRQLLRLAMARPTTLTALQATLTPLPPLLLQKSSQVLNLVAESSSSTTTVVRQAPSSAFFKPAGAVLRDDEEDEDGNKNDSEAQQVTTTRGGAGITSPVLGTDALYKQAGWTILTTSENLPIVGTSEEDDGGAIQVDPANHSYHTTASTSHALKMNKAFDGSSNNSSNTAPNATLAATTPFKKVVQIRSTMQEKDMLGLISPTALEDARTDPGGGAPPASSTSKQQQHHLESEEEEQDFVIPKSMREIYKISNHNRRNKKVPSPVHQMMAGGGANPITHNPMKVDTLEGANQVLEGYFDKDEGSSLEGGNADGNKKRQKMSDTGSFLAEIGWVKDKEEAETMKTKERANSDDFSQSWKSGGTNSSSAAATTTDDTNNNPSETSETQDGGKPAFDYSNVPSSMGVYQQQQQSNPFFAPSGSANNTGRRSTDASSSRGSGKGRKGRPGSSSGSNSSNNNNSGGSGTRNVRERPSSKPDGRSHAYKGKR